MSTVPSQGRTIQEEPLVENLNRLSIDGEEARTIDEALNVLRFENVLFLYYLCIT